ncbi:MAG: Gfo/Idh/MocA family oxidoreductase [Deltaproteobacteria bacterium]|nr:Gfo/Idh/MocA family oxidoreductase [Deltaproteobacteria bacterium]
MTLRAIVAGSGWGAHAAQVLARDPRVELVAVIGRGSDRTRGLAVDLGVPVIATVDEAVARSAPQLAVLAVGEDRNAALAETLVVAGCHVLCAHPVAPTAAEVKSLAALAQAKGVLVATDYSLRATAEHEAARASVAQLGALMRLAVQFPGRGLPMALELALGFGGRATRLLATRSYPPALADRVAATPEAFAPSVLVEHDSGAVSQLVPVTHARTSGAYRILLSAERGSVEARMPAGGARELRALREGRTSEKVLVAPSAGEDPTEGYRAAIGHVVSGFVDAVVNGAEPVAPLEIEIAVRSAWAAIGASLRSGTLADVEEP